MGNKPKSKLLQEYLETADKPRTERELLRVIAEALTEQYK